MFRFEALGHLDIFLSPKRAVFNWLNNDYSRTGVVQKIIRMWQ